MNQKQLKYVPLKMTIATEIRNNNRGNLLTFGATLDAL